MSPLNHMFIRHKKARWNARYQIGFFTESSDLPPQHSWTCSLSSYMLICSPINLLECSPMTRSCARQWLAHLLAHMLAHMLVNMFATILAFPVPSTLLKVFFPLNNISACRRYWVDCGREQKLMISQCSVRLLGCLDGPVWWLMIFYSLISCCRMILSQV